MFRFKTIKWFLFIIGVFIMATAAYTFTAANTVEVSNAGEGAEVISGYDVTTVHYILNAVPTTIDSVTFTLDSAPASTSTIKIKLVAGDTSWYSCTNVTTAVTCDTSGASVEDAVNLTVVVAD